MLQCKVLDDVRWIILPAWSMAAASGDSMVLVEIIFKDKKPLKANHKASTKISEMQSLYEPRIRAAHQDLKTLRVCGADGVEYGSEVTLGLLGDKVKLVFEEDDWMS
eukprot:g13565.t1